MHSILIGHNNTLVVLFSKWGKYILEMEGLGVSEDNLLSLNQLVKPNMFVWDSMEDILDAKFQNILMEWYMLVHTIQNTCIVSHRIYKWTSYSCFIYRNQNGQSLSTFWLFLLLFEVQEVVEVLGALPPHSFTLRTVLSHVNRDREQSTA